MVRVHVTKVMLKQYVAASIFLFTHMSMHYYYCKLVLQMSKYLLFFPIFELRSNVEIPILH